MSILNYYRLDESSTQPEGEDDPHQVFSNPPYLRSSYWSEPLGDQGEDVSDDQPTAEEKPEVVPDFELICLSDVVAKPINWLWPNRIAKGKQTILAGDPGLGKSRISLAIAAIVSNSRDWPDAPDRDKDPDAYEEWVIQQI